MDNLKIKKRSETSFYNIYHFPIMTIAWVMGIVKGHTVIALTIVLAFLSWHFVKKRVISKKIIK